jgi:hypothetical protein
MGYMGYMGGGPLRQPYIQSRVDFNPQSGIYEFGSGNIFYFLPMKICGSAIPNSMGNNFVTDFFFKASAPTLDIILLLD